MRLNSVALTNFRQHADTRIEFDSGLTGIIGPNGAGKTTILEAIAWAIYGQAAVRGTRDSIRYQGAGVRAGVRVELDFDLGGHRYRIVRGLSTAELYLDGATAPIANSVTGVTDLVRRRLGMSREEFFNTYFTGQKELSVMAAMGPSQRAQFLSHVLGYERLRDAQQLVRERRSEIGAQIVGLRQAMPDPDGVLRAVAEAERRAEAAEERSAAAGARRRDAESALGALRPRWETVQRERERALEMLSELRVAEGEEGALRRDLDRVDRELGDVAAARAERERLGDELGPIAELSDEYDRLDALERHEGRRRALLDARTSLSEELGLLRHRRSHVEPTPALEEEVAAALAATRQELEGVDGELEARRTEWVRDRQEAETKRQALRAQYAELKQQRERLATTGEEGACPTCLRPLGGSLASVLEMLDAQMETIRVDGNYFRARLDQLHEMPEDIRTLDERRRALEQEVGTLERRLGEVQHAVQSLAQLTGEIADKEKRLAAYDQELDTIPVGYDAARHEELRRTRERLRALQDRVTKLGATVEREPQLLAERERALHALGDVRARLTTLRAKCEAARRAEAEHAELREAVDRATEEQRASELAQVAAEGELSAARAAHAQAEQAARELADRQRALGDLHSARRLHEELDRAYTDLRTDLNYQLRPELSEIASAFLVELTDGRYSELELDDQYNIVVLQDGVPKPVISGGEEDLANLVLRLSISQMIAERAGQPFSLLILDEVFGSLDEMRRASVLELLRRLQDRFEQVIVITHIESVREGLDHVITVRYDETRGSSRVDVHDGTSELPLFAEAERPRPELERAGAGD